MRKKTLLLVLLILISLGYVRRVRAESGVEITPQPPNYVFGKKITFQAALISDAPPQDIKLILEAPGSPSFVGTVDFTPPNLTYVYNLASRPLRAFSEIVYRYRVELEGGETYTSPDFSFRYVDNRYTWQTLEDEGFLISWYESEVDFAQEILDAAQRGEADFEILLPQAKDDTQPISIYAYASASELQSTLMMTGQTWVAGHVDPAIGSIVVSLPPGSARPLEINRQIPHEMAHILLYRVMGDGYQNLPRWLNEGIASQMEASPNPDYPLYLEKAYEDQGLIPIEELCVRFPSDAATSFLAYAEAESLTGYLIEQHGTEVIRELVAAYQSGVGCERGVEVVLEKDLSQFERAWQEAVLGAGPGSTQIVEAGVGLLPWLVIFGAIFTPLLGFAVFSNRHKEDDYDR